MKRASPLTLAAVLPDPIAGTGGGTEIDSFHASDVPGRRSRTVQGIRFLL